MGGVHFFAPQFRPGGSSNSFTTHNSVRPPVVPHRPRPPHLPPPFSPPEDGQLAAPAYSSADPPPAYARAIPPEVKSLLDPEAQYDERSSGGEVEALPAEVGGDGLSTTIIVSLILLNVVVWGAVAWNAVREGQAARLMEDLQNSDRVIFDMS